MILCGAISTMCIKDGCNRYARYSVLCDKCEKQQPKKKNFLRRGE